MQELPFISHADDPLIGQYLRLGFLAPSELPRISHLRLLEFDVLEVVGRGGIGVVLKVRSRAEGTVLAVKALAPEHHENKELRSLFLRAGERQRRLEHPHILRVLELGEHAGIPYIVMPFVDGGSLSQHIRSRFPLDRAVTLGIVRQVAEALKYSHRHGYIHQDVKPQNILLGTDGPAVFITDYDLATTLAKEDTLDLRKSLCAGTLPYLPPGVACGVPEDLSRDMYSLGAVMYEMLTGAPPYEGTPEEVLVSIAAGPPVPTARRNPHAPRDLARICEGAMARARRARYADMDHLLEDLGRAAAGNRPLGPTGWVRRPMRAALAAAALLAAALIAGPAMGWLQGWRTNGREAPITRSAQDEPARRDMIVESRIEGLAGGPRLCLVADVDNDGQSEVLVGTGQRIEDPGQLFVMKFEEGRFRELFRTEQSEYYVGGVAAGDLDNDGLIEWVVGWGNPDEPGPLEVFQCAAGACRSLWSGGAYHGGQHDLAIGDTDGDGRNELVVGLDYEARAVAVYRWKEGGLQEQWRHEDSDVISVQVADTDGNGKNEIVLGGAAYNWYEVRILEWAGAEYVLKWKSPKVGYPIAKCADLDGDGASEILIGDAGYEYGSNGLLIYRWNGSAYVALGQSPDRRRTIPGEAGELFEEGTVQFTAIHTAPQQPAEASCVKLYEIRGGGLYTVWSAELDPDFMSPVMGDVDGDAVNELLVHVRGPGEPRILVYGRKGR